MRREFAMPDAGEGLTEAEIVTWSVAVGDEVTVNQILCEIETAKAAVELPSPFAGTVGELLVEPGQTVAVGSPIIVIETAEAAVAGSSGEAAAAAGRPAVAGSGGEAGRTAAGPGNEPGAKIGEAGVDGRIATLVGYGPRPGSVSRRPRRGAGARPGAREAGSAATGSHEAGSAPIPSGRAQAAPAPPLTAPRTSAPLLAGPQASASPPAGPALAGPPASAPPLAKPPVRKLARDLGVDLRAVVPAGADGVITREDVQAHLRAVPAGPPVAAPAPVVAGVRREPIRGVRKATAAAMVASAFTAPHVTEFLTVDVTETMALRDRLRATPQFADVKLTPLAFVAKAMCLAARRTPEVNSHWDEAAQEIVSYDHIQLGIAAATPRGLMVPKIRDADTLTLHGLAAALGALTAIAREGKTPPADLVGGTMTITNVGVFGVDTGTPILNPGEAAILAVGSIKQAPWVVDGALAVRTVCQLALSFDHRLVDGEQGSRFLADVGAILQDPGSAVTF
ncbi:MAG TPA: dihydrolipoamide acetyltransferase family protein [Pseudonocardia sp.]